jgi:tetratricopeptide (TPR) repeat protein
MDDVGPPSVAASPPNESIEPLAPPKSERFVFLRPIAHGHGGDVWAARDLRDDTNVALKTLRHLDAGAIYRIKREFRSLADVAHPNLARLRELVCEGEHWFLSMDLVEGRNFIEWVRPRGRLDEARLRAALPQLALALRALHRAGKLHRGLKPSNVLVKPNEQVLLVDFGLVTSLRRSPNQQDDSMASVNTHIGGNPSYLSPEQLAELPLTEASDWYSLGTLLFEALAGVPPFEGNAFEVLAHKQLEEARAARTLQPGVPADLDALASALLRRQPEQRPNGEEVLARLGVRVDANDAGGSSTDGAREPLGFVGRGAELATLHAGFESARRGRATVAHVSGEAGFGKTALLRRFLDEAAAAGALVLAGRCYERESLPYKALDAIVDDLARYLRKLGDEELAPLLPRDAAALARLFPVLGRVGAIRQLLQSEVAPVPPARRGNAPELRRRAFAALRELLAAIAVRRPVVLAIDDLHWGDVDGVFLLAELLRGPSPPPVLVVVTYRSEDADRSPAVIALSALPTQDPEGRLVVASRDLRGSTTAVRRLRDDAAIRRDVYLGPLERADAVRLARALLRDAAVDAARADELATEAEGQPLLIVELCRLVASRAGGAVPLPPRGSLDALLDARLADLSAGARGLLETIAAATRPIESALAFKAAAIESPSEALTMLRDARLVRSTYAATTSNGEAPPSSRTGAEPDLLEPLHDRIRARVLAQLAPDALADLHLRLANAIEAAFPEDAERLTSHFRAAGARWKAGHYAAIAAAAAARSLAFDRAATLYRAALEVMPEHTEDRRSARIALADALAHAGRGADAAAEYLVAAEGLAVTDMLALHRLAARHLLQSGHIDEGLAVITTVLRALDLELPSTAQGALWSLVARRAWLSIRGHGWRERHEEDCDPEALAKVDALWSVSTGLSLVDTIRAADFNARHMLAALELGEPSRMVQALAGEAWFSATAGGAQARRASRWVERTRTAATKLGTPHARALTLASEGYEAFAGGKWELARKSFDDAAFVFREQCPEAAWELATVQILGLQALVQLGRFGELDALMPRLLEDAHARGDRFGETTMRVGPASIMWLVHDEPDSGRRDVDEAMNRWSQAGFHLQHWYALMSRVSFDLYERRGLEAYRRLDAEWRRMTDAKLSRIERVRIESHFARGRAALVACTEPGASTDALVAAAERDARALLEIDGDCPHGYAHLLRAGARFRRRDVASARTELDEALACFERSGMDFLVAIVQRRRSRMLGGAEGKALLDASTAWMEAHGVQRPRRLAAAFAAGFQR